MIIALANEVADVDPSEFEKVGFCQAKVIAVPNIEVRLSLKSIRGLGDTSVDCQNTMFISYIAATSADEIEMELLEDPFSAGIIYRHLGSVPNATGRDYVELEYMQGIGALTLHVYFLVAVNDCTFGYRDEDGETHIDDYQFLWQEGLIKRMKT